MTATFKYSISTSILVLLSVILTVTIKPVENSKVLIIIPSATTSEKNAFTPLANGLGERGHEVTVVTKVKSSPSKNVREVIIPEEHPFSIGNPLEFRKLGAIIYWFLDPSYDVIGCERIYENQDFINLVTKEKFDLLITNTWFHQCFVGVAAKQDIPFIYMSTMPLMSYFQGLTGGRNPTSFVSNPISSVSDDMSFFERMYNTIYDNYWSLYIHLRAGPALTKVYRKYLGNDLPDMIDIERNVSLVFSNTHVATSSPRPMLPDVIEVGGMHCRPAKPLPKDLEDFISGGKDGFVYFSFGSLIQGTHMPEEWRKMFVNIFSRLKQRVLWKWENETMEDLPANVKLGKWLPQQDILGHPKLRLFITHGGAFSTQEALYHGVPFLGMPVISDQNLNMHHAQSRGYAILLEMLTMTEESVEESIKELLTNQTYWKNAKKYSSIFRDQPQSPVERAVYWTEYVLKYKGAHHLRSASRKLNFIQYHSLDVLATLIGVLLIVLYIVFALTRKVLRKILRTGTNSAESTASNKKNQ